MTPLRWPVFLVLLSIAAGGAYGEGAGTEPYTNAVGEMTALLAKGTRVRLLAVLSIRVAGAGGDEPGGTLPAEEKSAVEEQMRSRLGQDPGFTFIGAREVSELVPAPGPAMPDIIAASSRLEASHVLFCSAEVYRGGRGRIMEETAGLFDVGTGKELSRDTIWAVTATSGAASVFVNGDRSK